MIDEEIRQRILIQPSLKIGRIPEKTLNQWKSLADEEFCSDYGMVAKFLMDFYIGLIPSGVEHLEAEIDALKSKIMVLEEKMDKPKEEKKRTLLSGEKVE